MLGKLSSPSEPMLPTELLMSTNFFFPLAEPSSSGQVARKSFTGPIVLIVKSYRTPSVVVSRMLLKPELVPG